MSSLLEQIVRRRRASASRRLGPPPGQIPDRYGAAAPGPDGALPAPPATVAQPVPAGTPPPSGSTPWSGSPPANGAPPVDVPLRGQDRTIVWNPPARAAAVEPPMLAPAVKDEPRADLEAEPEPPPVSVWAPQEFFEPQPEPDAREPEPEPERKYLSPQQVDSWNDEPAPLAPQPAPEPTREPDWNRFQAQEEPDEHRRLPRWPRAFRARPAPSLAAPDWVTDPEPRSGAEDHAAQTPEPSVAAVQPFPPSLPPPAPVPEIAQQLKEEATARSIEEAAARALQEAAARAMQEAALASEPRAPASAAEIAAQPAPATEAASVPGFVERGRIRRRARFLRRLREVQLRDIGGFVVELHRFERERPDLVGLKVDGARRTQAELQALERALGDGSSIRELREAGIGGACVACGAVHGSEDRYCASCGEPLRPELYTPDEAGERGPDGRR